MFGETIPGRRMRCCVVVCEAGVVVVCEAGAVVVCEAGVVVVLDAVVLVGVLPEAGLPAGVVIAGELPDGAPDGASGTRCDGTVAGGIPPLPGSCGKGFA
jgi:hypothetical protein